MNLPSSAVLVSGVLLITLAVALTAAYEVIGFRVDGDGWLQESFALIPLAWFSGMVGTFLIAIALWRGRRRK